MRKMIFVIMAAVMVLVSLMIPASAAAQVNPCADTLPECGIFVAGPGYQELTFNLVSYMTSDTHVYDKYCELEPGSLYDYDFHLYAPAGGNGVGFQLNDIQFFQPVWCEWYCDNDPRVSDGMNPSAIPPNAGLVGPGQYYVQEDVRKRVYSAAVHQGYELPGGAPGGPGIGPFTFKDPRCTIPGNNSNQVPPPIPFGCDMINCGNVYTGYFDKVFTIATSYYSGVAGIPHEFYDAAPQCTDDCHFQCTPSYDNFHFPDVYPDFIRMSSLNEGPIISGVDDQGAPVVVDPYARAVFRYVATSNLVMDGWVSGSDFKSSGKIHNPDMLHIEITNVLPMDGDGDGDCDFTDLGIWGVDYLKGLAGCDIPNPWFCCCW